MPRSYNRAKTGLKVLCKHSSETDIYRLGSRIPIRHRSPTVLLVQVVMIAQRSRMLVLLYKDLKSCKDRGKKYCENLVVTCETDIKALQSGPDKA